METDANSKDYQGLLLWLSKEMLLLMVDTCCQLTIVPADINVRHQSCNYSNYLAIPHGLKEK